MASPRTFAQRVDRCAAIADAPTCYYVARPLHLVERVGGKAKVVEARPHLDVIVDRVTGRRSVLQKLRSAERVDRWHALAEADTTKRLDAPCTVTRAQLPIILDRTHKTIFAFGGNQSGKSIIGGHWLFDRILEARGIYLWLAPTQEKTKVGIEKLVNPEDNPFTLAAIPRELLVSWPTSVKTPEQVIRMIDGSTVQLRYCSKRGQNIKGLTGVRAVVLDEGTEVDHEINYTIAQNRLLMAGGQILLPTTPVRGHWLQRYDDETLSYAAIESALAAGESEPVNVKVELSCFDNPWMAPEEIQRTIESQGGAEDPKVQREIFGRWVAEGQMLWTHFARSKHVVEWVRRDVEAYGYVDVTSTIAAELFRGMTSSPRIPLIGGQDFNYWPMSVAVNKVLCRKGDDHRDPSNLIWYTEDIVVKRAKSTPEFGDFLSTLAGVMNGRGLKKDAFAGMHLVCDGTGFADRTRDRSVNATADAKSMREAGFVVRAPEYLNGKPRNPPRKVRLPFLNELMRQGRYFVNARCVEAIDAFETEMADDKGLTKKTPGTRSDRLSGITDAISYPAYAALFHRVEEAVPADAAVVGWGS